MPTELLLYFNDVLVYLICLIKMLSRARLTHRREEVLCQTMQGSIRRQMYKGQEASCREGGVLQVASLSLLGEGSME